MGIAEDILRKYEEIFANLPRKCKSNLRHDRSMVSISTIAEQYYCEQKLDLESEYPMPPTEQMKKSEAGHEPAATLGIPVSKEEAVKDAVTEREEAIFIGEFNVAWVHDGVIVFCPTHIPNRCFSWLKMF